MNDFFPSRQDEFASEFMRVRIRGSSGSAYRQEPRARKRRPKNYQLLTAHRHVFKEVHHREYAYRKPKKKAA